MVVNKIIGNGSLDLGYAKGGLKEEIIGEGRGPDLYFYFYFWGGGGGGGGASTKYKCKIQVSYSLMDARIVNDSAPEVLTVSEKVMDFNR